MSALHQVTLTPPRKRAASGADLRPYSFPAILESLSEPQSTPDAHSVPELVWDDTPESTKRSPRTPSSEGSPSQILSTNKEVPGTPTRPLKEPRRSSRIMAREVLKPIQQTSAERRPFGLESSDHDPPPLFPSFLYPAPPAMKNRDADISGLVKGDTDQRRFNFFDLSRRPHKDNTRSSTVTEAPPPQIPHTLPKQRAPVPKRVKQERSPIDQTADYDLDTVTDVPGISVNTADVLGLRQITVKSEGNSEAKVT